MIDNSKTETDKIYKKEGRNTQIFNFNDSKKILSHDNKENIIPKYSPRAPLKINQKSRNMPENFALCVSKETKKV